eukprot:2377912-Prymnesium_polylepis.1
MNAHRTLDPPIADASLHTRRLLHRDGIEPTYGVQMRVVVRARPTNESVIECESRVGRTIRAGLGTLLEDQTPYDCFSAVLGPESTQREAFIHCGLPMLQAAIEGQRACLFAYGQTDAGKT